MNKFKNLPASLANHKLAVASVLAAVIVGFPSIAGAATVDPVTSGMTSLGVSILAYLGGAIARVLVAFALGLGVRLMIKYAKIAIKAL